MDKMRLQQLRENAIKPMLRNAMAWLVREAGEASLIDYKIGANEHGEWGHQYHCHHDGNRLMFAWNQPKSHCCPVCGKAWTGEPFDSAWTSIVHVQIGRAVYHSSLLYAIDSDEKQLNLAKTYLLAYAEHYEGYRIHGEIPYNGPGKLFAQTLDEAHWIIDLAGGYDLIRERLSSDEAALIQRRLLLPCARFLIAHKEKQIHNHSVLITSAIASIGLLLNDEETLQAGLDGEYGLLDQIRRGLFEDGLWYEGNANYHFYAFKALLDYALIAEGTRWDIFSNKALKMMFDYPLQLILPDGSMTTLNDGSPQGGIGVFASFYELALAIYGDEFYRSLLNTAYGTQWKEESFIRVNTVQRNSLFALLFGQELDAAGSVNEDKLWKMMHRNASLPASGLTKIVNASHWHMLIKHSKFGGEHDHMDRLGLSVVAGEVPLFIDPGTTAYGVPMHFGWFKHTYSHNTVSLNGADQPPADGRIVRFEEQSWGAWTETAVDWIDDSYRMKDRIILPPELCPWDDEVYRGAAIRRINVLAGDHLLDIVRVSVQGQREVHFNTHISGLLVESGSEAIATSWAPTEERLSRLDQKWLKEKRRRVSDDRYEFDYRMSVGTLRQLCWCSKQADIYTALTPSNPPTTDRTTLIQRATTDDSVLFIQAFLYDREKGLEAGTGAGAQAGAEVGVIGRAGSGVEVGDAMQGVLEVTELADGEYRIELMATSAGYSYSLELHEEGAKLRKIDNE
jgi:hypothetical protein